MGRTKDKKRNNFEFIALHVFCKFYLRYRFSSKIWFLHTKNRYGVGNLDPFIVNNGSLIFLIIICFELLKTGHFSLKFYGFCYSFRYQICNIFTYSRASTITSATNTPDICPLGLCVMFYLVIRVLRSRSYARIRSNRLVVFQDRDFFFSE